MRAAVVFCAAVVCGVAAGVVAAAPPQRERVLRVCADPNNLPFSNEKQEGFENAIAAILANELGARVAYTWWAQRRGFVRNTIKAGACDVVVGVPTDFEMVATTAPVYRSGYVFVTRQDKGPPPTSLDDPSLAQRTIGVPLIGDDGANPPPVHALARRGLVDNVRGYTVYGDYKEPNPPARLIAAVDDGDVDVAIAWGPVAGWYARHSKHPLVITPLSPTSEGPYRFVFDISVGVKRGEKQLMADIERALARRRDDIARLLDGFGVPRMGGA